MSNFFIDHYLKHSLRREISELYVSIAIKNFAFSMIAIFEPVYIYKLYGSLSIVLLYYAVAYTLYLFLVPFGAKAAAKYGFEHCIFYSITTEAAKVYRSASMTSPWTQQTTSWRLTPRCRQRACWIPS